MLDDPIRAREKCYSPARLILKLFILIGLELFFLQPSAYQPVLFSFLRKIREAHHVVLKPSFAGLVHEKNHKSKALNDEIEFTGQIFCKACHYEWGVLLRFKKKPWYCIKASSFGFLFSGEVERQTFKKWKQCKAHVEDLQLSDLDSQVVKRDAQKN